MLAAAQVPSPPRQRPARRQLAILLIPPANTIDSV
jgi:hypothetical protein